MVVRSRSQEQRVEGWSNPHSCLAVHAASARNRMGQDACPRSYVMSMSTLDVVCSRLLHVGRAMSFGSR